MLKMHSSSLINTEHASTRSYVYLYNKNGILVHNTRSRHRGLNKYLTLKFSNIDIEVNNKFQK